MLNNNDNVWSMPASGTFSVVRVDCSSIDSCQRRLYITALVERISVNVDLILQHSVLTLLSSLT